MKRARSKRLAQKQPERGHGTAIKDPRGKSEEPGFTVREQRGTDDDRGLVALGTEEAQVQLSGVVLNLGSADTSCLHPPAAEVQPPRNQSHIPEWGSGCPICPDPQDRPPGPVSKKGG